LSMSTVLSGPLELMSSPMAAPTATMAAAATNSPIGSLTVSLGSRRAVKAGPKASAPARALLSHVSVPSGRESAPVAWVSPLRAS